MLRALLLLGLYFGLVESNQIALNFTCFGIGLATMVVWMAALTEHYPAVYPRSQLVLWAWVIPLDFTATGALVWFGCIGTALTYVVFVVGSEGVRHKAIEKAAAGQTPRN